MQQRVTEVEGDVISVFAWSNPSSGKYSSNQLSRIPELLDKGFLAIKTIRPVH
jgi:hypothetical protein